MRAAAVVPAEHADSADLRGVPLGVMWVAYTALATFLLAVYVPGITGTVAGYRALLPEALSTWILVVVFLDTLIHTTVAAFILWRRPREGVALLTSFAILGAGFTHSAGLMIFGPQDSLLIFVLALVIGNGGILLLPFLFPDGRAFPRWGPWYWLVLYVGMEMIPFAVLPVPAAAQFPSSGIELMLLGGLIAQAVRYRHHSTPLQRLQAKWFLFGIAVFVAFWEINIRLSNYLFTRTFAGAPADTQVAAQPIFLVVMSTAQHAAAVVVPIAVLIAVLRWRLFTIDLIINRTLVYAGLTVILIALAALASAALQPILSDIASGSAIGNIVTALVVIGAFLPVRRSLQSVADRFVPERTLLALLFTDIVSSTNTVLAIGDERWRELLDRYRSSVRREIGRFEGREIDNAGDGFFATFRSPVQALRAAAAIKGAVEALDLRNRSGVHVGECEVHGSKVSGVNVYAAARVMAAAEPGEILASTTVRDLVAGSQVRFVDRGTYQLKGLPDEWRLCAVVGA